MRRILSLLVLCAALPLLSCQREEMKPPPAIKPYNAPPTTLNDLSGKPVAFSSFKGKPVMVNFWATWCVPCVAEMKDIERLYEQRRDSGLVILAVNYKEPPDIVGQFLRKHDLKFSVVLDEFGIAANDFQVFGLPTTYFIDKNNVIQYSYMGQMTREIINMGLKTIGVEAI